MIFGIYIRYLIKNIVRFLLLITFVLNVVVLMFAASKTIVEANLPISHIFRIIPCILPETLAMCLPFAVLTSVVVVLTHSVATFEINVLRSQGIPPWKILCPIWIFALGISFLSVWLCDLGYSWGREKLARVITSSAEEIIYSQLKTNHFFSDPSGALSLEVDDVQDDELIQLVLTSEIKGKQISATAEKAKLSIETVDGISMFKLQMLKTAGEYDGFHAFGPNFNENFPLNQLIQSKIQNFPPMKEVRKRIETLLSKREKDQRRLGTKAAFGLITGDVKFLTDEEWKTRKAEEKSFKRQLNRLYLTIPRYWAAGFCIFCIVWVGAPLAIYLDFNNFFLASFVVIISVLPPYFLLFTIGVELAKSGTISPLFSWIGNVACLLAGTWVLIKIHRV